MHTGRGRGYMRQKLVQNLQMGIPVCIWAGNGCTCGKKIVQNLQMGIPVCIMKLCVERLLTHHKLIPVRIRGLPVCVRGGRPEILHMGSPHLHSKIVHILGATYTIFGAYSSKSNLHWYTLSEVRPSASLIRFLWLV
jgi:hypothetical protein